MRAPGVITGKGIWEVSNCYDVITNLATAKAVRTMTSDLIRSLTIASEETITVFSMAIGNGSLYKQLLRKEIEKGRVRVLGMDSDADLVQLATEDFPGNFMEALTFRNVSQDFSSILQRSITRNFEISDGSVDIVEARFVLHGFLFKNELIKIIGRIREVLKVGGFFVLGEVDNWIGSYIEKKIEALSRFYSEVELNVDEGILICRKQGVAQFPVLDRNNHSDKDAVRSLIKDNLEPVKNEAEKVGKAGWEEVINRDLSDGLSGRKWFRSSAEWEEIVKEGFGEKAKIRVISAQEIKGTHNDVMDTPFVLIATKSS